MKDFELTRAIKDPAGENEITTVKLKEEADVNAADFYGVSFGADGNITLGGMADAVANITSLTSSQVASMHPKDYIELSGEVGKYIQ